MLESAARDLRYGLRTLRRSPGFAAIAILTIALGIGATSAIFSVISAVALKPLPYPDPDRLVFITSQFPGLGFEKFWISPPEFFELQERTRSFSAIGGYREGAVNVSEGERPQRVEAIFATREMFDVLGVRPRLGRAWTAEDDLPNAEPVVVISDALWRRSFGADNAVIGQLADIQGQKRRIVGVAPPGFDVHDRRADVWMPIGLDPSNRQNRGSHFLHLVGRLKPGVPVAAAQTELRSLLRQWGTLNPGTHVPNDSTHRIQIATLRDEVIGNVSRALWMLQGAVVLVLLIACANVANLLLVRAESRHREFALRSALGAGRARILRQFIAEGLVITVIGAALGLAFAHWGLRALLAASPDSIPRSAEIGIDPGVLAFTFAVAVLTAVFFGLAPLLHLREDVVADAIKEGGARSTHSRSRHRIRIGLAALEIALAVMLVVGAGLLLRSFRNLTTVDAGFDARNLASFGVVLPVGTYSEAARRVQVVAELIRKLEAIPGVSDAAAMTGLPPTRDVNANDTEFENVPQGPEQPAQNVDYYQRVTAGYFETMGIRMVKGRAFNDGDIGGPPVVVVNEALAARFYPDTDPLGRRIRPPGPDTAPWFTIVGVARDVKQGGLDEKPGTELYFNIEQGPRVNGVAFSGYNFVLRSTRPFEAIAPPIHAAVRAIDPSLPIIRLRTMQDIFADSVSRQRFLSQLLGMFAGVALLLAAIGTYGVLSFLVTERRREIGIRVALGATANRIRQLVLRQGLAIGVTGVVVGVAGALALARVSQSLLFGVSPTDPGTYLVVALAILTVAMLACLVPAQRAIRVDPLVAIRDE